MIKSCVFKMQIEGCFHIHGRGTVVIGIVEQGKISVGDMVEHIGDHKFDTCILGIEKNKEFIESAKTDEAVGIFLKNVDKEYVTIGGLLLRYE